MKSPKREKPNDKKLVLRLKFIRNYLNLTQKDFADNLQFSRVNYSRIELNKNGLSFQTLCKLIDVYDINPLWLIKGWGPMFIEKENKIENPPVNIIERGNSIAQITKGDPIKIINLEHRIKKVEEKVEEFDKFLNNLKGL